LDTNDSDMH